MKKRKPSLIDRLGGGEADIKERLNINGEKKSNKNGADGNHAGDNGGENPAGSGSVTANKDAAASKVTN